ncbi:MAG: flagellar hook-length control protein FliK [Gammaproteobacteria bacterium]|nr:flagellar hook-length control protein FliK [Gammaproteobacteria bacterium]
MSDMTLPQVPQPIPQSQAPVKAAKAAPKSVDDAQESKPEQGFADVLKSRMDTESSTTEASSDAATDTADNAAAQPENATQTAADDGKPLPQTGKPEDVLLAVLTGTAAVTETSATEFSEPSPTVAPTTAEVETKVEVSADVLDMLNTDAATEVRAEAVVGATPIPAQAQPEARGSAERSQRAPWTTGARTELPQPAQAAVAQTVREARAETESTQTAPYPLERFGAEVRALAGAQPRAAGVEALADRLLGATPQTTPSTHAATQGVPNLLPPDAAATAATRSALPTATLETPLRQPGWDQALGERMMWVVNNKFQGVELKLNPAHLGPIEVRVQMHNDQAQVSFVAQHAPVREALEAALPRLREMFGANGFNLGDVNVSQHSFAEQQRHAQTAEGNFRTGMRQEDEADLGGIAQQEFTRAGGQSRGAIDLFA